MTRHRTTCILALAVACTSVIGAQAAHARPSAARIEARMKTCGQPRYTSVQLPRLVNSASIGGGVGLAWVMRCGKDTVVGARANNFAALNAPLIYIRLRDARCAETGLPVKRLLGMPPIRPLSPASRLKLDPELSVTRTKLSFEASVYGDFKRSVCTEVPLA
jgi:hypothetical protein